MLEGIRYAIKYGRVAGDTASKAIKLGDTSEEALQSYEETWKKEIDPKIKSAHKVQARWLKLSDDDWDKEIGIISNLTADEFLDFVRADFTVSKNGQAGNTSSNASCSTILQLHQRCLNGQDNQSL